MAEDFLNLPNKTGQDTANAALQQIASTLGVTTDALNSAVNLANTAGNSANAKIVDVESRFQTLTTAQQQASEVVDARKGKPSLKAKIDELESQSNENATDITSIKKQGNWIDGVFESGWTKYTLGFRYAKNDLGMVTVLFSGTSGTITPGTTIASLPVGYRPKISISSSVINTSQGKFIGNEVVIEPSGLIKVGHLVAFTTGQVYQGQITFYGGA